MPIDFIYGTEYYTNAHAHLDKDTIKLEEFRNLTNARKSARSRF